MNQLDNKLKEIKEEIFSHMLNTRGEKYKWFLRALRTFKYISMSPSRGTFLEAYYALMRYVDDVVDGDAPLPNRFQSSVEFVEEKIDFAKHATDPKDSIDYLMLYCFELANEFKQEFSSETQDILSSMLFDAKRYGKRIIFPEEELSYHFYLLDIRGTVSATLKIFGEDPTKLSILEPLGLASRFYYNIRDLAEDFCAGYVNIPLEDALRFGINDDTIVLTQKVSSKYLAKKGPLENRLQQLSALNFSDKKMIKYQLEELWFDWYNSLPSNVVSWTREHAEKIQQQLIIHNKQDLHTFGILARMSFPYLYENSAKRYSEKILSIEN